MSTPGCGSKRSALCQFPSVAASVGITSQPDGAIVFCSGGWKIVKPEKKRRVISETGLAVGSPAHNGPADDDSSHTIPVDGHATETGSAVGNPFLAPIEEVTSVIEGQYVTRRMVFIEDWAWDVARDGPAPDFINDMVCGKMVRGAWKEEGPSDTGSSGGGFGTVTREVYNSAMIIDHW